MVSKSHVYVPIMKMIELWLIENIFSLVPFDAFIIIIILTASPVN